MKLPEIINRSMKTTFIFSFAVALFLAGGCSQTEQRQAAPARQEGDTLKQEHHHEAEADAEQPVLTLNNGAKWAANKETTTGVMNMLQLVNEQLQQVAPDVHLIAAELDEQFNLIIKQCTMQGEAHEQLHHFLLPLRDRIARLKENGDKQQVEEIKGWLEEYTKYFE
ncbi:MAG: hypothetical protein K1X81_00065 [Bacteroidia bacterium]|nr:hypothetical protein [Bacteroidia bacterium]